MPQTLASWPFANIDQPPPTQTLAPSTNDTRPSSVTVTQGHGVEPGRPLEAAVMSRLDYGHVYNHDGQYRRTQTSNWRPVYHDQGFGRSQSKPKWYARATAAAAAAAAAAATATDRRCRYVLPLPTAACRHRAAHHPSAGPTYPPRTVLTALSCPVLSPRMHPTPFRYEVARNVQGFSNTTAGVTKKPIEQFEPGAVGFPRKVPMVVSGKLYPGVYVRACRPPLATY